MSERRHYPNAPIVEATISVGVVPPESAGAKEIAAIGELLEDRYPESSVEYVPSAAWSVPKAGEWKVDDTHEQVGLSFSSEDGKRRVRARLDGFDYSVSEPYDRWETFRDEARHLWNVYRKIIAAEWAVRVAVRYVNKINVPSKSNEHGEHVADLDDYLKISPDVPEEWPNGGLLSNYFMQLQMWQRDLECMLIVNEAPDIPTQPGMISIRLDFDLFKERYAEPWDAYNDLEIWAYLEKLHKRKNEVFEASITDETRELIR